jgi:glycosyltransferase involved in cell wall biosynthesis
MPLKPTVAIVSDALVQRGGAERVVEAMAEAFPDAPVFALLYSPSRGPASLAQRVRTSWLQRVPGAAHRHRMLFPLFAPAIESLDITGYDVVLSSHHSVAKGIIRSADQLHICYCHTPMRALWERPAAELATLPRMLRPFASAALGRLRVWDFATASRVDAFLANSVVTQRRISRHYRRESSIMHPPIDVERFTPSPEQSDYQAPYYLVASRAVAYKRVDIAVAAARILGRRLVVVGGNHTGIPAGADVEMLGIVDDAKLLELMRGARALLFPQYEDFGMTPLEMNACGRPVIAYGAGGALETVIDGKTGVLVPEQSVDAFVEGIRRFEGMTFDPTEIRTYAEKFSRRLFIDELRRFVDERWNEDGVGATGRKDGSAPNSKYSHR